MSIMRHTAAFIAAAAILACASCSDIPTEPYYQTEEPEVTTTVNKNVQAVNEYVQAANAAAEKVGKAAKSAADELDEKDEIIDGRCLICSDSSKSVMRKSDTPEEKIRKTMANYLDPMDKFDYFVVIDKGTCVYAAAFKNGVLATYPVDSMLKDLDKMNNYTDIDIAEYTYDQLYEKCAKLVS